MGNIFRKLVTCLSIALVFSLTGCKTNKETVSKPKETENMAVDTEELSGKETYEVEKILGKHVSETATSELVRSGNMVVDKGYKINASGNLLLNRGYKIHGKNVTVFFTDGVVSGWSM
ncbi:hypothetical protein ACFL1D_01940 [Candidatus Omnitrophota bacterium]